MTRKRSLTVGEESLRLDRFLVAQLPQLGRKGAAHLCQVGLVTRDGRRLKKSDLVNPGETIEVDFFDELGPDEISNSGVGILFEDSSVVIADKPAGMPSGALRGSTQGTLAGALLARYPELRTIGFHEREPGIVHRLDTQTSGAILAARSTSAFDELRAGFGDGRLQKEYLALTTSPLPANEGSIRSGLAPKNVRGRRVSVTQDARERETNYRVLGAGKRLFLVETSVGAAYRHQVRVHLAHVGCALLGDQYYGGSPWLPSERHALHASRITWTQTTGTGLSSFSVRAPLPDDFREALEEDGFAEELVSRLSSR